VSARGRVGRGLVPRHLAAAVGALRHGTSPCPTSIGEVRVPPATALRVAAALVAVFTIGCNSGAYPVDIFPEMHYQASQRRLEPNRLAAPADAVPVTGGRPTYTFDQAATLPNPVARTHEALIQARQVYAVNCSMCHGADGHGQGPIAQYFAAANAVPPVDFASERVRGRTDGQIYWIVANGLGNMPAFGELLTEEELWSVVHVIREVQGQ
jgi:mono/diheme cytochrome c family protein